MWLLNVMNHNLSKSFLLCSITWILCSLSSFITMSLIWYNDILLKSPNISGIEGNELLLYIISFSSFMIPLYFSYFNPIIEKRRKLQICIGVPALIIFIFSTVLFCLLKLKTSDASVEKQYVVFNLIIILYILVIVLWLFHTHASSPPDTESIEKKNNKDLLRLDKRLTLRLNKQKSRYE